MKTSNSKIIWLFYLAGMLIVLSSIIDMQNYLAIRMSIGTLLIFIAWIAILVDLIKRPMTNKALWIVFMIFLGGIAIPSYLITQRKNETV
jgi:hypothetical protein